MPIEHAVMKSTLAGAQIYGLDDRGVLAPGATFTDGFALQWFSLRSLWGLVFGARPVFP